MLKNKFSIAGRSIGPGYAPYVIAELSGNHNGDLNRALSLIRQAYDAGADAVKLQTYTPDTMTIDSDNKDFKIIGGQWDGFTLYDLYEKAHTPWEWHADLFGYARDLGIEIFSTPFDSSSVDFLMNFDVPAFKIASFELTDHALIKKVAEARKPMILSTGMASLEEIGESLKVAREGGCAELCLLYCVSGYPTPVAEANVLTLVELGKKFGCVVGFSDHTLGTTVSVAAVSVGASVVEKHVTLSRDDGGPDAAFSLEPAELKNLVGECRVAWEALGSASFVRKPSEVGNIVFRRSIYAVADIALGESFTKNNVRVIRPGFGLSPKAMSNVLSCRAACAISRGTAITANMLKGAS
jgi:N-acetylneuraminate synthase